MKLAKSLIVVALGISSLFGGNSEYQLALDYIQGKMKAKVELISSKPISKSLTLVVIEADGERAMWVVENGTKRIIRPEGIINEPNDENIKLLQETYMKIQSYNKDRQANILLKEIEKNPKIAMSVGANKKKATEYLVLDPNCPYCGDEVDSIDEKAQKTNLKIIVVGFLSSNSLERANYFYANLGKTKTDKDRINLLKTIFDRSFNGKAEKNKNTQDALMAVEKAKIEGVPYSFVR